MTQSFSGGSLKLQEASDKIDQKVKWTVRMAGQALSEVDGLIREAGMLGTNIQGINNALVMLQDINTDLNQHIIAKLNLLKAAVDGLK